MMLRDARGLEYELHADVAQLVEHHLAKVRVAGSSPVVRSREGFTFRWGPTSRFELPSSCHGGLTRSEVR
jgi:hypothetical protein